MNEKPCPDGEVCEHCKHFRRHYVRTGSHQYVPTVVGHCVRPRLRDKTVDTPACGRFSPRPKPADPLRPAP